MQAYEFSSKVTADGKLLIPIPYTSQMPVGGTVRVIVLVKDPQPVTVDVSGGQSLFSLDSVIAEIKATPQKPGNVTIGDGLLAKHLSDKLAESADDFDVKIWNQEWDNVEREIKAMELADAKTELNV